MHVRFVEELRKEYEGRAIILIVDADKNRGLLIKYSPLGYLPTIILFNSNATVAQVYVGFTEKSVLEEKLNGLLK